MLTLNVCVPAVYGHGYPVPFREPADSGPGGVHPGQRRTSRRHRLRHQSGLRHREGTCRRKAVLRRGRGRSLRFSGGPRRTSSA